MLFRHSFGQDGFLLNDFFGRRLGMRGQILLRRGHHLEKVFFSTAKIFFQTFQTIILISGLEKEKTLV
jgi:hypothetical protein